MASPVATSGGRMPAPSRSQVSIPRPPSKACVPAESAAQRIQLTKRMASMDIGCRLGRAQPGREAAGERQLDPAVDDADGEGLDRHGRGRHDRLAGAHVEAPTVPRTDQHAVSGVEASLAQREVLVRAVVLDGEERAGVANEDDRRAVDLDGDQLAVAQLVGAQDAGVARGRDGHGAGERAKASSRGSVMSSMLQRSPSRPSPDSLTPPYGIASVRQVGTSLTMMPPTSSSSCARSAALREPVKTPHCRPKRLSLMACSASAKESTANRFTTGANASSLQIIASRGTSTRTVGVYQRPFGSPPTRARAPVAIASRTQPWVRSTAFSSTIVRTT